MCSDLPVYGHFLQKGTYRSTSSEQTLSQKYIAFFEYCISKTVCVVETV